jgi:hypothetical protein
MLHLGLAASLVRNTNRQNRLTKMLPNGPNSPTSAAPEWVIGVDIGQRRDYSAIAILDYVEEATGLRDPVTYNYIRRLNIRLRHVERVHLGTPFHGLVNRVSTMLHDPRLRDATVVIDANGVGAPVVELFRTARLPCRLIPVQTTSGTSEGSDGGFYRVPKRDLVTGLQVLFDRWPLHISSASPSAAALLQELVEFKAKPSSNGTLRFEGRKDDLTMALALAWWWMRKRVAWKLPSTDIQKIV